MAASLCRLEFLPDDVANDPQALSRFQREAQAASALTQSHGGSRSLATSEVVIMSAQPQPLISENQTVVIRRATAADATERRYPALGSYACPGEDEDKLMRRDGEHE